MDKQRIIYYYQTFEKSFTNILKYPGSVTHVHLSSIHFGNNPDGTPYIHLNDNPPDYSGFDYVWKQMEEVSKKGVKVILMIGGAGGAFTDLFNDFDTYYPILVDTIKKYPVIKGIDLDIEEDVSMENVKMLINKLDSDFGKDFIIAMAPIAFQLEGVYCDGKGIRPGSPKDFGYKDLYNSPEGKRVDYFNGQFYGCFNFETYQSVINNGYAPEKVVIGMISGDFRANPFKNALEELVKIKEAYPDFGGTFVWEFFDAPPGDSNHPEEWAREMDELLNGPKHKTEFNGNVYMRYWNYFKNKIKGFFPLF